METFRHVELAEHHLSVEKDAKPVKQPLQRLNEERREAIAEVHVNIDVL
jgi:hypothetical protein